MAEDHLKMIAEEQEELDAEANDPLGQLEESFTELDLTVKPPSLMTRLAAKMLEVADAQK